MHVELLRQMPVWRKLELLAQLNELARTLALSGLCQRHPDASPKELAAGWRTYRSALRWRLAYGRRPTETWSR